jgi:dihydrofolate synthase/folylpolyglutamate synthase
MITTYPEAIQFLYSNLPMFQRIGASAYKKDLTNTLALCEALGNPQKRFKSIHVGGTNGKGSTSHMLASILQSAGYKTGLYTSPHLKEFTERIKINGVEVSESYVVAFTNRIMKSIETIRPSFFEITVAMAFDYFALNQVDVAVIEVGLGGRLDSTNVIIPEVSVITNIGFDHMDILGNTLEEIAGEKAGIIKNHVPVVISQRQKEIESVFITRANGNQSPIYFADDTYRAEFTEHGTAINLFKNTSTFLLDVDLQLKGKYQCKNLPGVLKTIDILNEKGWTISINHIQKGLEQVIDQTGLKGRWQILAQKPYTVCDTAHNLDGVREILDQIRQHPHQELYIIWGMVKDKSRVEILSLLPKDACYFFCQASIPRALDAEILQQDATQHGLHGEVIRSVNDALRKARERAGEEDMIYIGGSTFVVAELDEI